MRRVIPPRVVTPAPEIDAKFDPRTGNTGRWLGGDVAFSLPLGDGRVWWGFGDTHWAFPGDPVPRPNRRGGFFTNDSMAIQTGMDPATATFEFFSHISRTNLFEIPGGTHYAWVQSAIVLGGDLYVWAQRVRASDNQVDAGWALFRQSSVLTTDPAFFNPVLLYQSGDTKLRPVHSPYEFLGYVFAFALDHGVGWRLCRWTGANLSAGTVGTPEYLTATNTWSTNVAQAKLIATSDFTAEGSVTKMPDGRWVLAETALDYPRMKLRLRIANDVGGPYRDLNPPFVYDPPENAKPDVMTYAGRAHQWVDGALVMSYADNRPWLDANSQEIPGGIADDMSTYWPKFVRVVPPSWD